MGSFQNLVAKYTTFFKTDIINRIMAIKTKVTSKIKTAPQSSAASVKRKVAQKKISPAKNKTVTEEKNFRALVCAADGECFWTKDGRILQNLADLHVAFGTMDDEVFLHHTDNGRNDFADWVEYVLQDVACAQALRTAKKKDQAKKIVSKHLTFHTV